MKNQKSPEELYEYLKSHKGFEVARKSFLRQLEWEGNSPLENSMAESYAMLMVSNGGNKEEAVKLILKLYQPENLVKLMELAIKNEEVHSELINEILN